MLLLQVIQRQGEVLYLALVLLVQVEAVDGGTRYAFDVLLKLLLQLDVQRIHVVVCVLLGALGCTV